MTGKRCVCKDSPVERQQLSQKDLARAANTGERGWSRK